MTAPPMPPAVSIILPTYNRTDVLPRALRSVFDQDFQDFELLVIDNGSTPSTAEVLRNHRDPRMRCIRFEQNQGVGGARNEGVCQARGEIVAFIDSDDVWLPGKLRFQADLFRRYPDIEIMFGDYRNINHSTGANGLGFEQNRSTLHSLVTRELEPGFHEVLDGIPEAVLVGNFFATPTVAVRATVFNAIGSFDSSLSGPEDLEFWWRAALAGRRISYTDRLLIERHKDAASLSSNLAVFLPERLRALDVCESSARSRNREELIGALDRARGHTWHAMIRAYALEGRRCRASEAFLNSLQYGLSVRAVLHWIAALAGPAAIHAAKQVAGAR